jgi:hypothetical protein
LNQLSRRISLERDAGKIVCSLGWGRGFHPQLSKNNSKKKPRAVRYFTATQHNFFCAAAGKNNAARHALATD